MTHNNDTDLLKFAKTRAKKLRRFLSTHDIEISHSQSLEAVAHIEDAKDWNTYAARFKLVDKALQSTPQEKLSDDAAGFPLSVGDRIAGQYRGADFSGTLIGLERTKKEGVWRAKLHFDEPVRLPGASPALNLTRQRVRCMLDANGRSVTLLGKPDGQAQLAMP